MKNYIIAIDGPAGAGKSTISKLISNRLGINYIDTGAMYRAITLKCIDFGIDVKDEDAVKEICKKSEVDFIDNKIILDGKEVENLIRSVDVNSKVSDIAKIQMVREVLVDKQRKIGKKSSSILDGRDIATNVFPDAEFKFYIDASSFERGKRRFEEIKEKNPKITLDEVISDIQRRDEIDSNRSISPLRKAEDAVYIDTTMMSINEVVDYIVNYVEKTLKIEV